MEPNESEPRVIKSQPAPSEPQHQPALDGIRGIAVLAVMLSHSVVTIGVLQLDKPHSKLGGALAELLIPGWGGVDLFFVLSGFLITGILLKSRSRSSYFRSFYARRFLRIFPIYYLFLAVTLIAAHVFPAFAAELPASTAERLSFFFYLQNWPVFWVGWAGFYSLWDFLWSLAVEEQFYLIWPTLIRFVSLRFLFGLCIAGFVAGLPLRLWLYFHLTGNTLGLLQFPVSRLDGLFLGAAIALYRHLYGRVAPLKWATIAFALGACPLLYVAIAHKSLFTGENLPMSVFSVSGFALMACGLVLASQHPVAWLKRILTLTPLRLAGKYSYGMYMYHLLIFLGFRALARHYAPATEGQIAPFPALAVTAAAFASVAAVAVISFHFFEQPFLRLKRFFPSPPAPVS